MARNFTITSGLTDNYLSVTNVPLTGTPISFAAWINSDTYDRNWYVLSLYLDGNDFFALQANQGGGSPGILATASAAGSARSSQTGGFTASAWHHAGAVFASATSRIAYLDGSPAAANTESRIPANPTQTLIGFHPGGGTANNIYVAEAGIWNVALTDADMAMLALGYSPMLVRPEALVRYWPIQGRYSPETGPVGGIDLTLNNTCAFADHCRVIRPHRKTTFFGTTATGATTGRLASFSCPGFTVG